MLQLHNTGQNKISVKEMLLAEEMALMWGLDFQKLLWFMENKEIAINWIKYHLDKTDIEADIILSKYILTLKKDA